MSGRIKLSEPLSPIEEVLRSLPDHRRGANKQYTLVDAGMSAFSVFYMQAPSFLEWQKRMERAKGRNNARSLFGIKRIPSAEQIRNLLDPVAEESLEEAFWALWAKIKGREEVEMYRKELGSFLVSVDGTAHHHSQSIHCGQCRRIERRGRVHYEHQVLMAVVCAPEQKVVLSLAPEFITPQDGAKKQDSEQAALKRWIEKHSHRFADWEVTLLADDLHCHQPVCELALAHKMHFIFTCKASSHTTLYEELQLLEKLEGGVHQRDERRWNGRYWERRVYRWAEALPLRRGKDALLVNWCELSIYREETGKRIYYGAWATDHTLSEENIAAITAAGRGRWKVENEGNNVLKRHGYQFEHNYGHGRQHLSNVLLSFLLLVFLIHSIFDLVDDKYQAVRQELGSRREFFASLRTLTRFQFFRTWEQLLIYMFYGLELAPD